MRKRALFASFLILFLFFAKLAFASEKVRHLKEPNPYMILPFIILLLAIAIMPFVARHFWEKYYPHIACALGAVTVFYYIFTLKESFRVIETAIEYVAFLALISSLFIISGGLLLRIKKKATPLINVIILAIGSVIANLFGTTGAAMLLIRSYINANRYRIKPFHIIFFIFLICNIGGALTPIGDPPLFVGYLEGVHFFWTMEKVWHIWALGVGLVLFVFFFFDLKDYRLYKDNKAAADMLGGGIDIEGKINILYLIFVLLAVFTPTFAKDETTREYYKLLGAAIMLFVAYISYKSTPKHIHEYNNFNFEPIREVGFLFLGLFATMIPALDWLELNAGKIGITKPGHFFWATGSLSSFLDNTPTYLNFFSAAIGLNHTDVNGLMTTFSHYLMAISVGAVFFGAMTYIGNAPNFMVKTISQQSDIDMPSFFGYMIKYSIPILIPIFTLVWYLFFRG